MSDVARKALAAHEETLRALNAKTRELSLASFREEQAERELQIRADWEREVSLFKDDEITAVATWPWGNVLPKWQIGVGCKGQLLAVYEVTNYKGDRIASLKHSMPDAPPPMEVMMAVYRRWNLRSSR